MLDCNIRPTYEMIAVTFHYSSNGPDAFDPVVTNIQCNQVQKSWTDLKPESLKALLVDVTRAHLQTFQSVLKAQIFGITQGIENEIDFILFSP